MSKNNILSQLPMDLDDNLKLRFATPDDTDALAEFNIRLHEAENVGPSIRDLMSGNHPTCKASDFTVVEDTKTQKIVSSTCLISQTWTYSGIPFKFGQPEFVATEPAYRRRGLVRKQFEVIHALSAARGELMLGITGIPWYYRLFGYEMALDMEAELTIDGIHIPNLKKDETETCRLRPRTDADNAFIQARYANAIESHVFACPRTPALWQYEFNGRSAGSDARHVWRIIEDMEGTQLGYVQHLQWCVEGFSESAGPGTNLLVMRLELKPGVGSLHLMPSLLRALWKTAEMTPIAPENAKKKITGIQFILGREHPVYSALPKSVIRKEPPYAWYIRVPNLTTFLQHIQPALEKHLIGTVAEGYTGELKLSFYRSGIHLKFHQGTLKEIADWTPEDIEDGDAAFPDLTFLQLLCGRCRTAELTVRFVDCWAKDTAAVLLDCLFPEFKSEIWHL
ncbi:GNAT family N-acetyltransferase [Candidatus Poribacteria bacterium]|nr:GNAT family N-acetyltransferase [Candidatus Poribacteria bacterium]MYB02367.1 GNAT family N-acetyltransferase [Candidatus Poribacteria bacterium]